MMDIHEFEKINSMVDDLQRLCSTVGLSSTANEEAAVMSVFLYKLPNDEQKKLYIFCFTTHMFRIKDTEKSNRKM